MAIDRDKQIELVKKYEPILCFNQDEAFLPESINRIIENSILISDEGGGGFGNRVKLEARLKHLASLDNSEKYSLVLPELDLNDLSCTIDGVKRYGLNNLREGAKRLYGNNPLHNISSYFSPMYYARVRDDIKVKKDNLIYDGIYTIIQYYFFYIYNEGANHHQGDWDSTIEVCINKDNGREFLFYYQHHTYWLTQMLPASHKVSLNDWINGWEANIMRKKDDGEEWKQYDFGLSYSIDSHPLGFVAKGAHGVYPTPGISEYAINIPGKGDLPFLTDERSWGMSIGPSNCDEAIFKALAGVKPVPQSRVYHWDEPELLDKQEWLKFKGSFGQRVPKREGWSGPGALRQSKTWENVSKLYERMEKDYKNYKDRYNRGYDIGRVTLSKIIYNKHVLM